MFRTCFLTVVLTLAISGSSLFGQPRQRTPQSSLQVEKSHNRALHPLQVVAHFFELDDHQIELLLELRTHTAIQLEEIRREIHQLEEELDEILNDPDPNTAHIGKLVLAIHERREAVAELRHAFVDDFVGSLEESQVERLGLVHRAAEIAQILPAFHELGLVF